MVPTLYLTDWSLKSLGTCNSSCPSHSPTFEIFLLKRHFPPLPPFKYVSFYMACVTLPLGYFKKLLLVEKFLPLFLFKYYTLVCIFPHCNNACSV